MKITLEGNGTELVIRVPVNNPLVSSKSGKSMNLYTTNGNKPTDLKIGDKNVVVGLNVYVPKD